MILTKEGISRYFLHDYESGMPYEVSKEYYEWYNNMMKTAFEAAMPKLGNYPGKVIIYGTAGDMEGGNRFATDIFFNPPPESTAEQLFNTHPKVGYFMPREFKQPEPLKDDDLMPSGKHKGTKMQDVPAKHLLYIYENGYNINERVKQYIEANLDVIKQQAKSE